MEEYWSKYKKYQFVALEAREFIQIISSSSISQHLLKIENIIHENIFPFEDPNIKFFIIVIMSVNVKLEQCVLLKCIF